MPSWFDWREDEWVAFDVPEVELWESENPVVGELLGPDGEVLVEVRERAVRPFGFQPQR